jgi:septal ring factor EnvC (AmiA/AmiB activator)
LARTIEEINQEYGMTAAHLGDVTFKIKAMQDEVDKAVYEQDKLSRKMRTLNDEARKLQSQRAADVAADQAAATTPSEVSNGSTAS